MIKYISGDILQSKDEYIAQGVAVGSQEGLGTGLAFKLSSQFPEIQKLFIQICEFRMIHIGLCSDVDYTRRETFDFSYKHIASLELCVSCVLLKEFLDFRELT